MNNDSKRNNIIIGALLVTIALMTIGYAALATQSTINNKSNNNNNKDTWNVEFESITKNSTLTTTDAKEITLPTASGTAVSFNVELPNSESKITYDLTVVNKGTLDAKLNNIIGIDELNSNEPKEIIYEIQKLDDTNNSEITYNEDLLTKGRNHFRVTIKSNKTFTEKKAKAGTIYLNYIQKTSNQ